MLDNIYGRDEIIEKIRNFWSGVYGKHANNIK